MAKKKQTSFRLGNVSRKHLDECCEHFGQTSQTTILKVALAHLRATQKDVDFIHYMRVLNYEEALEESNASAKSKV